MKMSTKDYSRIKRAIETVIKEKPDSIQIYSTSGCTLKRFYWDLFHATGLKIGDGAGMPGDIELYSYLDDTHIDTALKSIVKSIYSQDKLQAFNT